MAAVSHQPTITAAPQITVNTEMPRRWTAVVPYSVEAIRAKLRDVIASGILTNVRLKANGQTTLVQCTEFDEKLPNPALAVEVAEDFGLELIDYVRGPAI